MKKKKTFSELFDPKEFKWGGLNLYSFMFALIVVLIVLYYPFGGREFGFFSKLKDDGNLISTASFLVIITILGVFGILFGEIGDRIPFWNTYVGGGVISVFFAAAIMGTYNLVPKTFLGAVKIFYSKAPINFLDLFIPCLIVGSVLSVNRKVLIKAVIGYIPLILIALFSSAIFGIGVGLLFHKEPLDVIMNFVLPIMGGGTGAGAVPLSEIWASKTGQPANNWFGFAISILTIANIIAIISASVLNGFGKKHQKYSGNGELIRDNSKEAVKDKEDTANINLANVVGTFFFTGTLTMFAQIMASLWKAFAKAHNIGLDLHKLVFLILTVMMLNVLNIVPSTIKAGAKELQTLFSKHMIWLLMAAVGFGTDVNEILRAIADVSNLLVAFAIVMGAIAGPFIFAKIMGFYPIEAAITAGLCMANRGGSGDVAVLGAADRMELMPFAQISSRIGGAIVLIIASFIFSNFL